MKNMNDDNKSDSKKFQSMIKKLHDKKISQKINTSSEKIFFI